MVDILKSPYLPTSYPSNIHNLRYNSTSHQLTLPVFLSNVQSITLNDRVQNLNTKRWIGQCASKPTRLLDVSNTPYSLHRKVMYQELCRHEPTIIGLNESLKNKPTNTKPTLAVTGTNLSSQSTFSNGNSQGSRLFDALSKHVTIKPEPLRPSNNFVNSSTTTITSWQRYWTSTNTQRRRKEANDPEPILYRPKREQSTLGQTHFVVLRDSPHPNRERHTDSRTPSTPPSSCNPANLSEPVTPDKPISSTKEDDSNIDLFQSSFLPSSNEINSYTKTNIPSKSIDRDDEKYLTEKSVLLSSSSQFKSDSQIINEVAQAQNQSIPISSKLYKPPLPLEKPKTKKFSSKHRTRRRTRSRSKSIDKKEKQTPPASKRKHRQSTTNKSSLSTIITTTSISKSAQVRWDEPYVGIRFDPPTPRCSPALFSWPQDSDPEFL